jgi:hypothetical protein
MARVAALGRAREADGVAMLTSSSSAICGASSAPAPRRRPDDVMDGKPFTIGRIAPATRVRRWAPSTGALSSSPRR